MNSNAAPLNSFSDREKAALTMKPDLGACAKSGFNPPDELVPLKRAVEFVNKGGNISEKIKACTKAAVILDRVGAKLNDQKILKETGSLGRRITHTVDHLNPKLQN